MSNNVKAIICGEVRRSTVYKHRPWSAVVKFVRSDGTPTQYGQWCESQWLAERYCYNQGAHVVHLLPEHMDNVTELRRLAPAPDADKRAYPHTDLRAWQKRIFGGDE